MILAATLVLAPLAALAEGLPQMIGGDLLTKQILLKAAQENGGVTAVVRVATGQSIELKVSEAEALAPLKPAEGLVAKAEKPKAKKPSRRAVVQLKQVASRAGRTWGQTR